MLAVFCGPAVIYCALSIVHNLRSGEMMKWEGDLSVCEELSEPPRYYVNHQCKEKDIELCSCR